MAIRDRVTITLGTGEKFVIQVSKAGGELETNGNTPAKGWTSYQEVSSNGNALRKLSVADISVAAVLFEMNVPPETKKPPKLR